MITNKAASITEIKNHILMKLKPGQPLTNYLSYRGNDMLSCDLDLFVGRLLRKEYGNTSNFQHVTYYRI